jgi:hypothetical protein
MPYTRSVQDGPVYIPGTYRAKEMRVLENFMWRESRSQHFDFERFSGYLEKFSASEPRDRVFAAVQLYLKWNDMPQVPVLLVPDYSKSVANVYRDATRFIFRPSIPVSTIELRRVLHRSSQDLAVEKNGSTSWTIDFDRTFDLEFDPVPFGGTFNAGYKKNTAPDDVCHELLNDPDPNLLIIKALLVDTVTTTTESFTELDANEHAQAKCILETLRAWEKESTIAEVLTGSRLKGHVFQFKDSFERLESYHCFCRYVFTLGRLPPARWELLDGSTREERHAVWFYKAFRDLAWNRRFFLTENGRIGCGPKLMQEGDVVSMAKGAQTACILRPVKGTDRWLFVGEAYVHGLMHGEIFDQEEINWEWVKLR